MLQKQAIFIVKKSTSEGGLIYCLDNNQVQNFCEAQKYKFSSKDNAFIITSSELKSVEEEARKYGFQDARILSNLKWKNYSIFSQLSDVIKYKIQSRKAYILYARALAMFREGLQKKKDEKIVAEFWNFIGIAPTTAIADCRVGEFFKGIEITQLCEFKRSSLRILAGLGKLGKYIVLKRENNFTVNQLEDIRSNYQEWDKEKIDAFTDDEIEYFLADPRSPSKGSRKKSKNKKNLSEGKDSSKDKEEIWLESKGKSFFRIVKEEIANIEQEKKNGTYGTTKKRDKKRIAENKAVLTQLMDLGEELYIKYKG